MNTIDFLSVFITFFAVIDPIGTVPIFIAVTSGIDARSQRRIALIATAVAAAILLFFVSVGELILTAMKVPLPAFEIAGGIVLFLFALTMIFGESKPEEEMKLVNRAKAHTAVFPLAVPSIASPGAMLGAVMLTENARFGLAEQIQTAAMILAVLLIAYLLMLFATWIYRWIGDGGASVVSRIMGLILASIATTSCLKGIEAYFGL